MPSDLVIGNGGGIFIWRIENVPFVMRIGARSPPLVIDGTQWCFRIEGFSTSLIGKLVRVNEDTFPYLANIGYNVEMIYETCGTQAKTCEPSSICLYHKFLFKDVTCETKWVWSKDTTLTLIFQIFKQVIGGPSCTLFCEAQTRCETIWLTDTWTFKPEILLNSNGKVVFHLRTAPIETLSLQLTGYLDKPSSFLQIIVRVLNRPDMDLFARINIGVINAKVTFRNSCIFSNLCLYKSNDCFPLPNFITKDMLKHCQSIGDELSLMCNFEIYAGNIETNLLQMDYLNPEFAYNIPNSCERIHIPKEKDRDKSAYHGNQDRSYEDNHVEIHEDLMHNLDHTTSADDVEKCGSREDGNQIPELPDFNTVESISVNEIAERYDFSPIEEVQDQAILCNQKVIKASVGTSLHNVGEKNNLSVNIYPSVTDALVRLYRKKKFCDVTLQAGGQIFKVHRLVLCLRSAVFQKNIKSLRIVDINDMDPDTLNRMIEYMYSETITDLNEELAKKLYFAAVTYEIKQLQELCSSFLVFMLSPSNVCDTMTLSENYLDADLKIAAEDCFQKHADEIMITEKWKTFMENKPHLAAEMMHQYCLLKH